MSGQSWRFDSAFKALAAKEAKEGRILEARASEDGDATTQRIYIDCKDNGKIVPTPCSYTPVLPPYNWSRINFVVRG